MAYGDADRFDSGKDDFWEDDGPYDGPLSPFEQQHGNVPYENSYTDPSTGGAQNADGSFWYPTPSGYPNANAGPASQFNTPAPPTTTTTPTPPPAPPPGPGGNNGGGGNNRPSTPNQSYRPPALTPSPFIMPNGMVPPGLPFSPDPQAVQLQNDALQRIMTQDVFGQDYINKMNEQQKEIALAREQQGSRELMQRMAGRGVLAGGGREAGLRRLGQDTSRQLLQSQRDVTNQATSANRAALMDAIGIHNQVYGERQDRGLNIAKLMEAIRMYDQDLLNRQAEFGSGMNFNYDSLNANNERSWLDYLARLGGQ